MRYVSFFSRVLLFAVLLVAAPQLSGAASPADEMLDSAVSKRLMEDKHFDATNIIVTSENGNVYLRGEMRSPADLKTLREAAMSVPGVKNVTMQVEVLNNQK